LNRIAGKKRASHRKNTLFKGRNIFFGENDNKMNPQFSVEKTFLESSIKKIKNDKTNKKLKTVKRNDNSQEKIDLPEQFLEYKKYMAEPRSQVNFFKILIKNFYFYLG
jgi:hypothetical protein